MANAQLRPGRSQSESWEMTAGVEPKSHMKRGLAVKLRLSEAANRGISAIRRKIHAAIGLAVLFCGAVLFLASPPLWAISCTTQASMQPVDRQALLTAGNSIAGDVAGQNFDQLQASLLPAVIGEWDNIRGVAQGAAPVLKGGKVYWGDGYLLDATDLKAPADTEFFCTNADSAATMTINLRSLPPGRYALLIGDYTGAPLAGQLALILGTTDAGPVGAWKLGGLFAREGALE